MPRKQTKVGNRKDVTSQEAKLSRRNPPTQPAASAARSFAFHETDLTPPRITPHKAGLATAIAESWQVGEKRQLPTCSRPSCEAIDLDRRECRSSSSLHRPPASQR